MNYKLEHFVRRLSDGKVLPVVAEQGSETAKAMAPEVEVCARVNEGEPE